MRKILSVLMTLVLAGTALGGSALAAGPSGGRVSPAVRKAAMQERHRKVIQRLHLTPEQRQKIHEFKAGYRQRVARINAQLHVKKVELENEMEKPSPDQARVKQLTDEIGKLKAERDLERLKAKHELEKVLTPEQSAELKRLQAESGENSDDDPSDD